MESDEPSVEPHHEIEQEKALFQQGWILYFAFQRD